MILNNRINIYNLDQKINKWNNITIMKKIFFALTFLFTITSLKVLDKNITDKVYFSYGYGTEGTTGLANYGLPQTYGLTTAIRF